jgi:prolyl oligopeptidase
VVKRVMRGQPLSAAMEIFRGSASDGGYGVSPITLVDGAGHSVSLIDRPLSTFESEKYLVVGDHAVKLPLPMKSTPQELIDGRLIVSLDQDWTTAGQSFRQGSLVALNLAALRADPANLKPTLIMRRGRAIPSPRRPPPRTG